jgi:hypothetical protein
MAGSCRLPRAVRNKVIAMRRQVQLLTFTAIGDAYGVYFEYAPR